MKLLTSLLLTFLEPPVPALVEDLHIQLLNDWIVKPEVDFLHPQCTWNLADGHPCQGLYRGSDFYPWYINQLAVTHPAWNEAIREIIGSSVGGIVIGEYHFQREVKGLWYAAPFTHFYRIHRRQITSIRCFMGEVSIDLRHLSKVDQANGRCNAAPDRSGFSAVPPCSSPASSRI